MNDPENFLTRWSRRKRSAADVSDRVEGDQREQAAPDAPPTERATGDATPPAPAARPGPVEPAFDLSSLPPIETITAETDIRAFLAPGVPAELRLAALRRAWVADPKVRDFVGLNDYDFDFHTPGAIPGFGSLEMTDELRREAVRIVSTWQSETEAMASPSASASPSTSASPSAAMPDHAEDKTTPPAQPEAATKEISATPDLDVPAAVAGSDAGQDQPAPHQGEVITAEATTQRSKESVAAQQKHSPPEDLQTLARRNHGRALPK